MRAISPKRAKRVTSKRVRRSCVICGKRQKVESHHIGGRSHLVWITAPLCRPHHERLHRLIESAGIVLEYTADPVERLIRATKAINIFMCMVCDALHEVRSLES
jgi:hypothetical protein